MSDKLKARTYACVTSGCDNVGRAVTIEPELVGDGAFMAFPEIPVCVECGNEPRIIQVGDEVLPGALDMALKILRAGLEHSYPVGGRVGLIGINPDALRIVLDHLDQIGAPS